MLVYIFHLGGNFIEIDVYQYLVDNNLLDDFVKNFSVTRNIKLINKIRVVGYAYYMDNYSKRTLVKCGRGCQFDLPFDLKELLKNDKDFAKCVYMFYTLKRKREVDNDDVLSIKRIVEIDKEINKLKNEKDNLMESMSDILTL